MPGESGLYNNCILVLKDIQFVEMRVEKAKFLKDKDQVMINSRIIFILNFLSCHSL